MMTLLRTTIYISNSGTADCPGCTVTATSGTTSSTTTTDYCYIKESTRWPIQSSIWRKKKLRLITSNYNPPRDVMMGPPGYPPATGNAPMNVHIPQRPTYSGGTGVAWSPVHLVSLRTRTAKLPCLVRCRT
ncbi:hypothetical protein LOK49_LG13G00721 [Camellia lanceoleosa]|uniref:Uncharacterized protein n=1 Tax=Camellia lanceoleosa TaxID=1840588 RepID=A0ACC0FJ10_9ERIC|nr:hypothetical protein LOK49_LG13G00721 [Camellia lanceoleosa]